MKLLVIKSVFVPKFNFVQINLSNTEKLIQYLKQINRKFTQIVVKLVGWIDPLVDPEQVYLEKFNELVKMLDLEKSSISISIESWDRNYGKCRIFQTIKDMKFNVKNKIYELDDFDFVLYGDHDISPLDDILTERFLLGSSVPGAQGHCREIGIISFSQIPDSRHSDTVFAQGYKIQFNNKTYCYHDDNIRIASGCFITVPKILHILSNMYYKNVDPKDKYVYGEEDILIGEMMNLNNFYNIVSSLRVSHPYHQDDEYDSWKVKKLLQCALQRY